MPRLFEAPAITVCDHEEGKIAEQDADRTESLVDTLNEVD
jgi:hypothetical protein